MSQEPEKTVQKNLFRRTFPFGWMFAVDFRPLNCGSVYDISCDILLDMAIISQAQAPRGPQD